MLLMIDNYDSFTYNLVQYLGELGEDVRILRNDAFSIADIEALQPQRIVISPGPCTPDQAGLSMAVIREFGGRIPILGVCLGHQCIGQVYGGRIVAAPSIMHGKTSAIQHQQQGVFADLTQPFTATRYHSLVIEQDSLPECLQVTAWTETPSGQREAIMGVKHRDLPIEGVQFHPESILTEHGHDILRNFLSAYC